MPRVAFIAAMAVFGLCHNAAAQSTGPNPIYDAASYQKLTGSCANGKKYLVDAPNGARLPVVHTYGNTTERGVAYGTLLADEIVAFGITGMARRDSAEDFSRLGQILIPAVLLCANS